MGVDRHTSLGEGVDRRAIVVEIVVRSDGSIAFSDVYPAAVRNHAKLADNSVAAWLDGTSSAPARVRAVPGLDDQLRVQDRVAQQLRQQRFEHGALTLETLEARAVFADGIPSDLMPEGRNRAKDLIEGFMIAENGVTAIPRWRGVSLAASRRALTRALGQDRSAGRIARRDPAARSFERGARVFLLKRREVDPARFADLSLAVVKLLGRGEYVLDIDVENGFVDFARA